jgi:adenylosuccinate synthase
LFDADGETLRKEGQEYGTVTGRPRRCGWFDAELMRVVAQLNGLTEIALTKLDVLDTLPKIKICVGYRCKGSRELRHYWEGDAHWLEQCEPEYVEIEGWVQSTKTIREFGRLPRRAQVYVHKIEELVGVPVRMVSTGPGREDTIRV